ncbi:MAG: hypothetical protein JXR37_20485 [Kiritimatiellae bacterium]|nr:hypothetical protein [Kiritimatiellia bacterium]
MRNVRVLLAWVLLVPFLLCRPAAGTTIDESNRYAWAASTGWINCRTDTTNGAVLGEFVCSGYLYCPSTGWIHLGDGNPTNGYQYTNTATNDYGVNHDGKGNLAGNAWCPSTGWILFEQDQGKPKVDLETGVFSGYAWGYSLGWISFSNSSGFCQTVAVEQQGSDTDGDDLSDMWELSITNDLTALGGTNELGQPAGTDFDGDGVVDSNEYLAGTNPLDSNDYLRVTDFQLTGGSNFNCTWSSDLSRMYRLERSDNLTNEPDWVDSGLGVEAPDTDTNTTRTLDGAGLSNAFFRVKAVFPLSE